MDNLKKILIIDDNHSHVDSVKVIVKELNFNLQIDSADRYSNARKMLQDETYSLILLDNETETNQKGVDFIESIIKTDESYSKENFIVFSSKFDQLASQFKQKEVKAFGKPFKIPEFQQYATKVLSGLSESQAS